MRANEQIRRLKEVPLFAGLTVAELREVRRMATELEFPATAHIVEQGASASDFYLLLSGEAAVIESGRLKRHTLVPGDYFGEMSVIDGGPRTATIMALSPVVVLRLDSDTFDQLIATHSSISRKMLVGMAQRLRVSERSMSH